MNSDTADTPLATATKSFPNKPGVYRMFDAQGHVLYVGKAKNLKKRVQSYFRQQIDSGKTRLLMTKVVNIEITVTQSDNEAFLLEQSLIKELMPRFNVLLRDDKSYPYIALSSQHPFPRLFSYRGKKRKDGRYFGPYSSASAVTASLDLLQKLFQLRSCTDTNFAHRQRPCLQYQIKRCTAPCVQWVSKEDYQAQVDSAVLFLEGRSQTLIHQVGEQMDKAAQALEFEKAAAYRDQLHKLRQVQEQQYVIQGDAHFDVIGIDWRYGQAGVVHLAVREGKLLGSSSFFPKPQLEETSAQLLHTFLAQYYLAAEQIPYEILCSELPEEQPWLESLLAEKSSHKVEIKVPARGPKRRWIALACQNAQQALLARVEQTLHFEQKLVALQQLLQRPQLPQRLECFDISHTGGQQTVAACVVFDTQGARKSDYRRFNIEGITPGDDYAALYQAVSRRFKRLQQEQQALPDILIIDGGKYQLDQAVKVMAELGITEVSLLSIAKGPGRKAAYDVLWQPGRTQPWVMSDQPMAFLLIQQIRDEAHRFAITGHRARRRKQQHSSVLDNIEGIGAARRRELLRRFGGIQALERASKEEIAKTPGISAVIAERIYATLHAD